MRPVDRGNSPQQADFDDYRDAFGPLVGRIGPYCSYCERLIPTQLAVEHIQPKNPTGQFAHLIGRWTNYLLACVNCNSTKGEENVQLDAIFLPDRDNTAAAFAYTKDGKVQPANNLEPGLIQKARDTLELTGLDKPWNQVADENGELVFVDRVSERMQTWLLAESCLEDLNESPTQITRRLILKTAQKSGFFSIWMKVFEGNVEMRRTLVGGIWHDGIFYGFEGTALDCFDASAVVISPRPKNALEASGKI